MVAARALPTPTDARPGSLAKIEALRRRVARGERLWHPDDNKTPAAPAIGRRSESQPPRVTVICADGTTMGGYRA